MLRKLVTLREELRADFYELKNEWRKGVHNTHVQMVLYYATKNNLLEINRDIRFLRNLLDNCHVKIEEADLLELRLALARVKNCWANMPEDIFN